MSIQQKDTRRSTAPVTIDLTATEVPRPPAADRPKPAAPAAERPAPVAGAPGRGEFDVLKLQPARYDRWDRLYRNIVLALFAVGMVAGFWFRH
ncbi:hypothetical protein [Phreatobacter cathodiphilus]|uniref:Uncharacterized protein n=1 Tax=Phreatobacter cathodiphilus TaxID=1868589 RepID=A0A2S0NEB6_9HYPH|nr:hypothetical protein [Phreatobacter cathodiphilus]AVO46495.1 hypothetical protein C6569_16325 [Phreatobacter cathodiphilus]